MLFRSTGLEELRVKESDRLAAMAAALTAAGARVEEHEDGLTIHGTGGEPLRGTGNARVKSLLDHRIAMSMAVAGLVSTGGVEGWFRPCLAMPEISVFTSSTHSGVWRGS